MHTSRRRMLAGVAALSVIGALTAACGGSSHHGGAGGAVTLYTDNPQWKTGFDQVSANIKTLTGSGLEPLSIPSTASYEQVIRSSIQTPKTADIVKWWAGYRLQDLARTGSLTDLTPLWDQAVAKGWVDPALKGQFSYQGKVYGLPMYESRWVVFYDKKMFADNGLKPPTTYAEFLSVCQTLKDKGIAPVWTGQADGWTSFIPFEEFLSKLDPAFYTALTNGQASYTDPKAKQAMSEWKDFIDKGYTSKTDIKFLDAAAQMKAGKLAMIPMGTWYNGTMQAAGLKSGTDYGAFLWPAADSSTQPSTVVESGAWTLPADAPDHDAALKVLGSWLDPTVQTTWSTFLGDSSANPTVVSTDPTIANVVSQLKASKAQPLTRYWEASPPALVEGNVEDLAKFMLDPSQADSVLASMAKRADTEWATWRKSG